MYDGQMVFPQLLEFLPRRTFETCVRRYRGQKSVRTLTCRDQFLAMMFAQLTGRQSLRDLACCLSAMRGKLYHAGFRGEVCRSTLADANRDRDWRIWQDLGLALIERARQLYADADIAPELTQQELTHTVYALDATVIDLSLTLFPWAHSQRQQAAFKLHTLLDLQGNIPCFLGFSSTKQRDVALLDTLPIEAGAFYVMDRDYNDFARLYRLQQQQAFFVVRGKRNLSVSRQRSQPVEKQTGLRSDQVVRLRDRRTARKYPEQLRRVTFFNAETGRRFVFVTNHFHLPALTITRLYWQRWEIELFFKWIKQHLRIKHFFGNSPNAVKTQIWIAVSTYCLIAILKRELQIQRSLSEILHILSLTLFEKTPIFVVLEEQNSPKPKPPCHNQLTLFDL
jgi:hypothetical protein